MDEEPEAQEELLKLLTYQVTYDNKQGALAMFMGYTPMIFISSNNETIYGTLGSYEKSAFEEILKEFIITSVCLDVCRITNLFWCILRSNHE